MDALTQIDIDGRDLGLDVVDDGRNVVTCAASVIMTERGSCRCEPSEDSGGSEEDALEGRHFCVECYRTRVGCCFRS